MRPRGRPASRAVLLAAAFGVAAATAAAPGAGAATRLFIRNHVHSEDARGLAAWNGGLAAATTGGVLTVALPAGPATKILSAPGGLPSNQTLCVVASPSGALWIGTASDGIARLRPDGGFRRTLTSFDGLPNDRVQTLTRSGDSVWVGTSGGVALFTENAAGQVSLRRSDSNASTAGALISDNVRAIAVLGDTVWCATDLGLAAFASGAWLDRRDVYAGPVNALLAAADTLWVGAATGPRAYAGGVLAPLAPGHAGACLALGRAGGAVYSATNGPGVFRYDGAGWVSAGAGLPLGATQALAAAPDGALWTGTQQGLARLDAAAAAWTRVTTDGPLVDDFWSVAVGAGAVWFGTGNTSGIGTGGGFAVRYDGSSWSALTTDNTGGALQAASTFGVFADRSGSLWLGHCCSAASPQPRVERYDPADGSWLYPGPKNVLAFGQDPSGRVYGASDVNGVGVSIFDGATGALVDSLTPQNTQGSAQGAGLTNNDLRGISFDPLGRGWIALNGNGLDRWDGKGTDAHADDAWAHFGTGFPSQQSTSVVALDATTVYVGTRSGVAVLGNDVIDLARQGAINALLGGAVVWGLAADPRGIVWLATATGLLRFDHAAGTAERFTTADGLVDDDVRSVAWDESSGTLWAATAHGASEIRPAPQGAPAFGPGAYVYPNPLGPGSGPLRIGGLAGAVSGEIRDGTGRRIRSFHADPLSNAVWDLTDADGGPAAPGIYLVVLRDGARSRILRAAVIR